MCGFLKFLSQENEENESFVLVELMKGSTQVVIEILLDKGKI